MIIKKLILNNYRNHKKREINFKEGLNIIVGNNAVGKTNIVEAIYFASLGKSLKTNNIKELVNFNEENAYVKVIYLKNNQENTIEFGLSIDNKKRIAVNKEAIKSIKDLLGNLNTIYFTPDELRIIKESPNIRRRFLDITLSQHSKTYYQDLIEYGKILKNRNILLKNENIDLNLLDSINKELAKVAIKIIKTREELIASLNEYIEKIHYNLTQNKELLKIDYINDLIIYKEEERYTKFIEKLEKNLKVDKINKTTTYGPHRDDIEFYINNLNAKKYASQGQQRTIALSLKLAEAQYLYEKTKSKPIILLDDVLSELDEKRSEMLIKYVKNYQTIITTTNKIDIEANIIQIKGENI